MASLQDSLGADLSRYQPKDISPKSLVVTNPRLNANPVMRCPLPPFNADPDVLRQVEVGGGVPTTRIIPLPPISPAPPARTAAASTSAASSSSGGGGSTTVNLTAATVSFNVASLSSLSSVTGTVAVTKKSFQLISISTNAACEVRLYGTALAQLIDSSRLTDAPVPAEVSQNVMTDVIFDTPPYNWGWQNRIAANQDTPQTGTIYITVVNNTAASIAGLTVTIVYLPLES